MPLSADDQQRVQKKIETMSAAQRAKMCEEAEATLAQVKERLSQRSMSKEDGKAAELAIETLVRSEAAEQGKGLWFRSKRRIQLTKQHLSG